MRHIIVYIGLLTVLLFGAPAALQAQTIRVQSGDHPGFTRLVLPIGADREWTLEEQPEGGWRLALTPTVEGFDISNAFNLIQRTRLQDLVATQDLSLDLACACDVSSFRHDTRFLVIDIADPDPNAPPPEDVAETSAAEGPEATTAAEAIPNLVDLLRQPDNLPPVALPVPEIAPAPEPDAAPPNPRLAEAAQIMAEQLARAAASGLLDVALRDPTEPDDPEEVSADGVEDMPHDEAGQTTPNPHQNPIASPDGDLPIRAQTALDTSIPLDLPIGLPMEEASCNGAPFVAAEWSQGVGLYQELGALRRDLYDERDMLTVDGAVGIAQHYLFYGFGAEATYWLRQLPEPPETLLHVAALVDGAETAPFIPVETTEGCSDGELLWRYLAGAVNRDLGPDDTAAIQRAFGLLPPLLRDHMGPRLATKLMEDGHAGTARNVRDVLYRGGRIDAAELRLLDLELGFSPEVLPEQMQEELAEAMRDDGADPAAVLALALAFDRSMGTLPQPSRLTTADALMREVGNGPETDDLWRETLLGYAALGQIEEALNRLGDPARSDTTQEEALTDLIAERVAVDDTAALVVLAYTHGRTWRPEGSEAGRIQVRAVAALREEGLFEAAQILRDVRRPLILPTPEVDEEEVIDEAEVAWTERDWARLSQTTTGAHADVATRMAGLQGDRSPAPPDGPPDLNSMNDALNDSRALRAVVAELLAQPTLP